MHHIYYFQKGRAPFLLPRGPAGAGRCTGRDGMAKNVLIRPLAREQYDKFMARGRVLFFSAPCGCGKSTLARALLSGCQVLSLHAGEPGFALPADDEGWEVLLIDDLQQMTEEADRQALCQLIREYAGRRFVLLSRGAVPGWLMAFQYAGLMAVLDTNALLWDREDIRTLFHRQGTPVGESVITEILRETSGYPLGVAVTAHCMADGRPYSPELVAQCYHEVFFYFEAAVYRRFDLPIRRFLLELAPFESFDVELARMVSGDPRAGERLGWLQQNTTMLRPAGVNQFRFWAQFRTFLLWEMDREYSDEKRRTVLGRGGLYYELKEDYSHALECYTMAGDHSKVSELLVRNAELHPGMGHYSEMEKYYRSLPEQEIAASPALMQGMSMLCALAADYEGSERWYRELSQFARSRTKSDAAGRQARGRLSWLDISLPQRGVTDLTAIIPAAYRLLVNKEVVLPAFSVTSALPSIMNGGKDFSEWSRRDDLLYQTIRTPVEAILGRDGVGLPDCAIAESKFEKGEDITARMLSLMSRLGEIQRDGTPDIEFAAVGLLARSQLAAGHAGDARRTLESLRQRFAEGGQSRFLPNIDAMLCRVDLRTGDTDAVDSWYREKAPRDPLSINIMKRYQYFTQAMAELSQGRPEAALLTLAPLESYCVTCQRKMDHTTLLLLRAVAQYRLKDEAWRQSLTDALRIAAGLGFIRPVSCCGAALLPLLQALPVPEEESWYRQVVAFARVQAARYPYFLVPPLPPGEEMTATELQVLRLMCADKSNAEIGRILDIKLPTVKTHVSHILTKLNVSRRSEAKTAARRLWLVE